MLSITVLGRPPRNFSSRDIELGNFYMAQKKKDEDEDEEAEAKEERGKRKEERGKRKEERGKRKDEEEGPGRCAGSESEALRTQKESSRPILHKDSFRRATRDHVKDEEDTADYSCAYVWRARSKMRWKRSMTGSVVVLDGLLKATLTKIPRKWCEWSGQRSQVEP